MTRWMGLRFPFATFARINLDELYLGALCWSLLFVVMFQPHRSSQGLFITSHEWYSSKLRNCCYEIIRTSLNCVSPSPAIFLSPPPQSPQSTCWLMSDAPPSARLEPIKGSFNLVSWQRDSKQQSGDLQDISLHQTVWPNHPQHTSVYTSCNNFRIWDSGSRNTIFCFFFKRLH